MIFVHTLLVISLLAVSVLGSFSTRKDLLQYPEALCLDGTHGAYYYRVNPASRNWIFFHEGGGWMYNFEDAEKRSTTEFGSAKYFPKSIGFSGILSGRQDENALFYDWNVIYMKYCDGSSFSSYREKPVMLYEGEYIYFRGQAIREAVKTDVYANFPLLQAERVVVAGCSAGGLATYLHLDWWRANLPASAQVVGMADAGWFYDNVNYDGYHIYAESIRSGFEMWNASAGVDNDCVKAYPSTSEIWKCALAQYVYPFIQTPIFVLNARFDSWSVLNILQLICVPYQQPNVVQSCSKSDFEMYTNWGSACGASMLPVVESKKDGIFLDSCNYHCQSLDDTWNVTKINGLSLMQAFASWMNGQQGVFVDSPYYGVNPTCPEKVFNLSLPAVN